MQISDERRGRVGRWLRSQRLAHRYETQKAMLAAFAASGWTVPASVYSEWESGGRVPSGENMARLREFFGSPPEPSEADDLAAAIRDLVEELRLGRLEQAEWNRGVQDVVMLLAERLAAAPPTGDPERVPLAGAPR